MRGAIFKLQRGQAMIEALIACTLVLVPLFLAIPMIAKYMDIRSTTVQAARYAAWERTVWFGGAANDHGWNANAKADAALLTEIGPRFLSESCAAAAFKSPEVSGNCNSGKRFWNDRKGNKLVSYDAGNTNTIDIDNDTSPGVINKLLAPLMAVAAWVSSFSLDTSAQYTTKIHFSVKDVAYNTQSAWGGANSTPSFTATNDLGTPNFTEKNVLVANGWSANGPGSYAEYNSESGKNKMSVYRQVRGLTPTSLLNPTNGIFKSVLDVLKDVLGFFFPELKGLNLGKIEPDKVPEDRLKSP